MFLNKSKITHAFFFAAVVVYYSVFLFLLYHKIFAEKNYFFHFNLKITAVKDCEKK